MNDGFVSQVFTYKIRCRGSETVQEMKGDAVEDHPTMVLQGFDDLEEARGVFTGELLRWRLRQYEVVPKN